MCGGSGCSRSPRSTSSPASDLAQATESPISGSSSRSPTSADRAYGVIPNSVPPIRCRQARSSAATSSSHATAAPAIARSPL